MKFVKIMSLILVVAMMSVCFAACGGNNADNTTVSSTTSSTTTSGTTTSSTTTSSTTTTTTTPAPDPDSSVSLLEIGETAFAGWSNGTYVEETVNTNGTNGLITIVFTPARNNWQHDYNLLSINGVSIIRGTASGGVGYTMGSTAAEGWTARVITITIDPETGNVTMVDTQGNEGTANVGPIGSSFTVKINQDQTNSWELTSLVITQVK